MAVQQSERECAANEAANHFALPRQSRLVITLLRQGLSRARRLLAIADSSLHPTVTGHCVHDFTIRIAPAQRRHRHTPSLSNIPFGVCSYGPSGRRWRRPAARCLPPSARGTAWVPLRRGRLQRAVKRNNLFLFTAIHKVSTSRAQLIHRQAGSLAPAAEICGSARTALHWRPTGSQPSSL